MNDDEKAGGTGHGAPASNTILSISIMNKPA